METPLHPQPRSMGQWTSYTLSRRNTDASVRHQRTRRRRPASDELKLFCMGYKQELVRSFTLFNNAGVAFSLLSPLTALTGTYGDWGLLYGGPVVMMWGLPLVTLFSTMVALSLAEMASAYPTSGAVYYSSWALAPSHLKALASWLCGWLLVLGQTAFTAANCRIFTDLLTVFVLMATGTELSLGVQLVVFLAVLVLSSALASVPNSVTAFLTSLAALWNAVALAALAVALPALAVVRQPLSYVFTHWHDGSDVTGVRSWGYNCVLGLLTSQYMFLGFDSCAHLSEETRNADVNAPRGMLAATLAAGACGYLYLLALNLVAMAPGELTAPGNESRGTHAVAQLFWNVHRAAYDNGHGGLALLTVPLLASLVCTSMCVAANARMLFAFSRDGAVPLHRLLSRVEPRTRAPVPAAWVVAAAAALLGAPGFFLGEAYEATLETLAVVNTYLSYGVPVFFKLLSGHGAFLPGPFHLGANASRLINAVSLAWISFITVVFSLPLRYPVTAANMNYNAAGTLLVLLAALAAFYCPVVGGRYWFTGPRHNLGRFEDDVAADALAPLRRSEKKEGPQSPPAPPAATAPVMAERGGGVASPDTQTTTGGADTDAAADQRRHQQQELRLLHPQLHPQE